MAVDGDGCLLLTVAAVIVVVGSAVHCEMGDGWRRFEVGKSEGKVVSGEVVA